MPLWRCTFFFFFCRTDLIDLNSFNSFTCVNRGKYIGFMLLRSAQSICVCRPWDQKGALDHYQESPFLSELCAVH